MPRSQRDLESAFFCFLILLAALPLAGAVPSIIEDPDRELPFWFDVETAVDENGKIRWDLFPESRRNGHQEVLRRGEEMRARGEPVFEADQPCLEYTSGFGQNRYEANDLATATEYAEIGLLGRVRAVSDGFVYGRPVRMLEVEVDSYLKRPSELAVEPGETLLVSFDSAEVRVPGGFLCARNAHYPDAPAPNLGILVLSEMPPPGRPLVLFPPASGIIFERGNGSASLSWARGPFVGSGPAWELISERALEVVSSRSSGRRVQEP